MNKSPPVEKDPAGSGGPPFSGDPPVLLGLLGRAVLAALSFCLLSVLLYAVGLRRDFSEASLLAIIQMAVYGGIALAILSLYRFVAGLWFGLRRRRPRFLAASLVFLLSAFLGALLAAAGTFIAALAGGNV